MAEQKAGQESLVMLTEDEKTLLRCTVCQMLVQDPVQFRCLHNACKRCLPHDNAQSAYTALTCPTCGSETEFLTTLDKNSFLSNNIDCLKVFQEPCRCDSCSEDGKVEMDVESWCSHCRKRLCHNCLKWHSRVTKGHTVASLEEVTYLNDFSLLVASMCRNHGKPLEFICFPCDSAKCLDCVQLCINTGHDIGHIGSDKAGARILKIRHDMEILLRASDVNRTPVSGSLPGVNDVSKLRRAGLNELLRNKKAILNGIDKARKKSESLLLSECDSSAFKAVHAVDTAVNLKDGVDTALHYCSTVVSSTDVATVLQQCNQLLPCLRMLVSEIDQMQTEQDSVKLTVINSCLPGGLKMAVESWTEAQQPSTSSVFTGTTVVHNEINVDGCYDGYSSAHSTQQPADDKDTRVLNLATSCFAFQTAVQCYDIAITPDGSRLLLAAREHGLLEYDTSGKELSSYRPDQQSEDGRDELVRAVAALDDRTVAVGLFYSRCVVLLHRYSVAAGVGWQPDNTVLELQSPPYRLSVHSDQLLAVSERRVWKDNISGRGWWTGPGLRLVSLSGGRQLRQLFSIKLDYDIIGLAVTAQAVITANSRLLSDGSVQYSVDSYSHSGQRLWRQERSRRDWAAGVCAAPSGRVIYLALPDRDRVTAVSSEDGRELKDVLSASRHGLKRPWLLSLSSGATAAAVAVLGVDQSWEGRRVSVYREELGSEQN